MRHVLVAALLLSTACSGHDPTGPSAHGPAPMTATEVALATGPMEQSLEQGGRSVAALADGGFAVVWQEQRDPARVALQFLAADGSRRLPDGGRRITDGSTREDDGFVAAHPTSGAFVGFAREVADRRRQVVVQWVDGSGGSRWPGAGAAASDLAGPERQGETQLLSDDVGGVYACFSASQGSQDGIRCQHLDADGQALWGGRGLRAADSLGVEALPRLVSDGRGGLMVFGLDLGSSGSEMVVEGQRFTPDGAALWGRGGRVVLHTGLFGAQGYSPDFLKAVSDGQGGAIVASNDWRHLATSALDVVAQRVGRDGDLQWGAGAIVAGTAGSQQLSDIVGAGDGGVFVAATDSNGGHRSRVLLYRVGPDGQARWPSEGTVLSDPAALGSEYGAVLGVEGTTLCAFWTHQKLPDVTDFEVQGARFAPDGRRLDAASGVPMSSSSRAQFTRAVAFSPVSHRALLVWDDARWSAGFGQFDVYGAIVTAAP